MAGGRQIPGWVQWVLTFLGGAPWPEADEDAARRVAGYHRQDQQAAEAFVKELERELDALAEAISGKAHDAIAQSLRNLIDAGRKQGDFHGKLAAADDDFATNVEYTKEMIIGSLIALAIQLGAELALEWCSLGTSSIAAAGSIAITRAAIMAFFRELVTKAGMKALGKLMLQGLKIGFKEGMIAGGIGAGLDLGIQTQQTLEGHRHGVDLGEAGKTFAGGFAGGAAGGLVGRGAGHGVAGALGEHAGTTGGKIATGAVSGLAGGVAGAGAGAAAQGGDLTDMHTWASGVGLGGAMGAAAGFRGRPHVETPGSGGIEGSPPKPLGEAAVNGKLPAHDGASHAEPKPELAATAGGHEPATGTGQQEHGQQHESASLHDAQPQHEQQAIPVAEARQSTPETKPAPEQQRAAPSGDPSRGGAPSAERQLTGRDQPTPNTGGGERPTVAPGTRLPEQPAATLSNTAGDRPHAGAAATTRETSVAKAAEPIAAKPGEQLRATSGLPETRPTVEHGVGEAKAFAGREGALPESATPKNGEAHILDTARPASAGLSGHVGERPPGHAVPPATDVPVGERVLDLPSRDHATEAAVRLQNVLEGRETPFHGDERTPAERQALRDIWDHATPQERVELFKRHPMFGEHAELPVREADHHARQAAESLRDELRGKQESEGLTRDERNRLHALDDILESVKQHPKQPPRFLLGFEHDGRSITSVGDPDKATHTLVFAPGTFTGHEKLNPRLEPRGLKNWFGLGERAERPGYMEVSRRMWHSITDELDHENVAVIDYQNYHAPQSLVPGAARSRYAREGAQALREHCDRLQRTNEVEGNKLLVAGHSYGTVLVGEAAKGGHGLNADGVLNLGSPGLRVSDVTGLKLKGQSLSLGDGRAHTMTRPDDPIRVVDLARKLHLDRFGIGHGLMPHHDEFGGTVHSTGFDPTGPKHRDPHSAYFDEGSVEMKNIGKIAARLEHLPEPLSEQGAHSAPDAEHLHPSPDESYEASDTAREAARSIYERAATAEPTISKSVVEAVSSVDGHMERFDSRLKTEHSLARKLDGELEFVDPSDHEKIAKVQAGIKDSVRYTAVVPDEGYWSNGDAVAAALSDRGYALQKSPNGWARDGYKGRNMTFKGPDDVEFEVQVHTRASLDAAEQAHRLYEVERLPSTPLEEKRRLRQIMRAIFDQVPVPPGTPWKD